MIGLGSNKNSCRQKLQYTKTSTHLNFKAQKRTLQFASLVDLTHGLHKYTQGKIPIQHKNGYQARALRALGLLSSPRAESARAFTGRRCPHSGRGQDFLTGQPDFFTETAVTP